MRTKTLWDIIISCLLLVISCGSGGGDSNSPSSAPAVATKIVSGVASNGAAMTGTVYLQDGRGTEKSTAIGNEGSFAITVDDLTAPFLLKAVSTDHATTRYSFAAAQGTAHINPFTHVAVAGAAGTADLDTFYQNAYVTQYSVLLSGFNDNVAALKNPLGLLFANFNVTDTNFLSGNIQIGKGVDAIFDNVKIDVNATTHTITLYGSDPNKPFISMMRQGSHMVLSANAGNIPNGTTNVIPIANAGTTQNVVVGTLVTLDGSGSSDAKGDLLTYNWSLTSKPNGSSASLSNSTTVKPRFSADIDGTYVFGLVVNDGKVDSAAATVTVTASVANAAPVANAGKTQSVVIGTLVTLDGSGSSDANGDLLTFSWTFTSKPTGSSATLSSSTAIKPTFTADVIGTYVLNLVVSDGKVNSAPATVSISSTTNTGSITIKW